MKSRILVTGCAGFIGYHVTACLIKKNYNVVGLDNLNNYYDKNLKLSRLNELKKISKNRKNYKFYRIDICDRDKLKKLFKNYKFTNVIHLAAQAGIRFSLKKPEEYIRSNLVGFFNILSLSKEFKILHLVYASSSSVYGSNKHLPFKEKDSVDHPLQLYAVSKRSNELMAHSYSSLYNLPTTGLRFFTVYGPFGRPDMALFKFVKNILSNKSIEIYNNGMHLRDFTYISDVVSATIKSIKIIPKKKFSIVKTNPSESNAPFRIVNVGSDRPISLMNCIKLIEKIIGKKSKKKFLPVQKGDIIKTHSDISKIKKIYNYKVKTSFKTGLTNFINWYKNYYKIK